MFKEFKEFAVKGNAFDLAIGVIIGAAFGSIVSSFVKDIIMPPISLLTGGLDFSNKFVVLKAGKDGADSFTNIADAVKAGAVTAGRRQLHYPHHQLCDCGVCDFPDGPRLQQNEETATECARGCERLPGLHDVDPDQGNALSALHVGAVERRARLGGSAAPPGDAR